MKKIFRIVVVCLLLGFFAVVEVQAGANVVPVKVSGPGKAFVNQTISVTFRVSNDGNETSGPYEVGLYLSENRNINPKADYFLKKVSIAEGLAPGESVARTAKVVLPEHYLHGFSKRYYYGAMMGENGMASRDTVLIARYRDNGDGTVTDYMTGLMWEQDNNDTGRHWSGAKDYCERLELAGHDDWTMPPLDALLTILDRTQPKSPHIDPVFGIFGPYYYVFWSMTNAYNPIVARVVVFTDDRILSERKDDSRRPVRCVRYAK